MTTALLSIHPRHVAAILSGRKTVELRRVTPRREFDRLWIYETRPTCAIVAVADVHGVLEDSIDELWRRVGARAAVTEPEFRHYFAGRARGCAVLLGRVRRTSPTPLAAIGVSVAPQGWRYLEPADAEA